MLVLSSEILGVLEVNLEGVQVVIKEEDVHSLVTFLTTFLPPVDMEPITKEQLLVLEEAIFVEVAVEVTTIERESLMHEVSKELMHLLERTIAEAVGVDIPYMRIIRLKDQGAI